MATIQKTDQGIYKGKSWSLRWASANDQHTVTLREDGQASTCYEGSNYNDAHHAFVAQQGQHFDEDAERKRRSGL